MNSRKKRLGKLKKITRSIARRHLSDRAKSFRTTVERLDRAAIVGARDRVSTDRWRYRYARRCFYTPFALHPITSDLTFSKRQLSAFLLAAKVNRKTRLLEHQWRFWKHRNCAPNDLHRSEF